MTYHAEPAGNGYYAIYDERDRLVCYCTDEARAERLVALANEKHAE